MRKIKQLIILSICIYSPILCTPRCVSTKTLPTFFKNVNIQAMNQWVDSVFNTMTTDEKIGQLFMIVVDPTASYHERTLTDIRKHKIGGILFSSGQSDNEAASINLYQKYSRIPLFIALDGEWGLSMRLTDTPRFPKNMMLGAIQNNNWIHLYGKEIARECRELGIQINFAPILDVNVQSKNPVIGIRSFSENPRLVSEKGLAYARGLEKGQVISVGKHFPGHGSTVLDSHKTLPRIDCNRKRLDNIELYPFVHYIHAGFSGIMTGHLHVPSLDSCPNRAASLSPSIVTDLLTNKLGFDGLKFTDALVMKGVSSDKQHSLCVEALLAGNDILLSPRQLSIEFAVVKKAVKTGIIPMEMIDSKCLKILRYKYITGLYNRKPIVTQGLHERIKTDYSKWLIQKLNEEAITLLKNERGVLPLKQLGCEKIAVVSLDGEASNPFWQTMSLYNTFDFFHLPQGGNAAIVFEQLKKYNIIICAIHSDKMSDLPELQELAAQKTVHLCFFTSPYTLSKFRTIKIARSVLLAYENTEDAQKVAAEILMGGLPAKGRLPVTIAGKFACGTKLTTRKVRLSYGHPMDVNISIDTLGRISSIVLEGVNQQAFPGCQILIAKDGVVIYNRAFGDFDYTGAHPVQTTDLYDLASITKAVATVPAIMKLYNTGQLKLQDPLSQYIPELKNTDKKDITICEALFHKTGLPATLQFYMDLIDKTSYIGSLLSIKQDSIHRILVDKCVYTRTDFKFKTNAVSQTPKKGINKQVAENFYIRDDFNNLMLKKIVETPLRNDYHYSDLNFILLKEVIENLFGQSLDMLVERHFYAGLGAATTTFQPLKKFDRLQIAPTENDGFLRNQILIGYPHDEIAALSGGISGNAGLFSNANDLAKLLQMLLNEGEYGDERYLSATTVRLFTQTKDPTGHHGLGFDKPNKQNTNSKIAKHASVNTYGHTGYTGTCFWVDPDQHLIYIFLSNRVYPSRTHTQLMDLKIRLRIQEVIYNSLNRITRSL